MKQEEEYTTISIKKNTWLRLNQRKAYPSQTFDIIINNLFDYEMANMHYTSNDNNFISLENKNDKTNNQENPRKENQEG